MKIKLIRLCVITLEIFICSNILLADAQVESEQRLESLILTFGDERKTQTFIDTATDENRRARVQEMEWLLGRFLSNSELNLSKEIYSRAIRALSEIDTTGSSLVKLKELMEDEGRSRPSPRDSALYAFAVITNRVSGKKAMIHAVAPYLADDDVSVVMQAAEALASTKDDEALKILVENLTKNQKQLPLTDIVVMDENSKEIEKHSAAVIASIGAIKRMHTADSEKQFKKALSEVRSKYKQTELGKQLILELEGYLDEID